MGILDRFKKKEGKDVGFTFGIEGKISYPKEKERWELFGKPLCSVINQFYEKGVVEYFTDEKKELLTAVNVICWGPNFSVTGDEEEFYKKLFAIILNGFDEFFKSKGINYKLEKIFNPLTMEEEIVDWTKKRFPNNCR
jgi:hypothetical protein